MKQVSLGLNLSTKKTRKREFLDEMNLARVEYYLSDVLSCMETQGALQLHVQRQHFGQGAVAVDALLQRLRLAPEGLPR